MALPVSHSVYWRTLLHTLVLVQEERLFTAEAVGGILPTRRTACRAATTHLACRITPVRSRTEISRHTNATHNYPGLMMDVYFAFEHLDSVEITSVEPGCIMVLN